MGKDKEENTPSLGKNGFPKKYWKENYSEPETMDGIGNAKEHALYIKSLFRVQGIAVNNLIDLGCGLGHLGKDVSNALRAKTYVGIDPSNYAFKYFQENIFSQFKTKDAQIYKSDIVSFLESDYFQASGPWDLGLCSSVLQYMEEDEIHEMMNLLFTKCRYLYLSVPTDKELERQVSELGFLDKYAIRRPRKVYFDLIRPYFNFVSYRILESKFFFDKKDTKFHDFLFRFE